MTLQGMLKLEEKWWFWLFWTIFLLNGIQGSFIIGQANAEKLQEIKDKYAASDLEDGEEFDLLIEFQHRMKQNAPQFIDELLVDAVQQFY